MNERLKWEWGNPIIVTINCVRSLTFVLLLSGCCFEQLLSQSQLEPSQSQEKDTRSTVVVCFLDLTMFLLLLPPLFVCLSVCSVVFSSIGMPCVHPPSSFCSSRLSPPRSGYHALLVIGWQPLVLLMFFSGFRHLCLHLAPSMSLDSGLDLEISAIPYLETREIRLRPSPLWALDMAEFLYCKPAYISCRQVRSMITM